jgi:hypothetical protein
MSPPTDHDSIATVAANALPATCTAPDCTSDPEYAWRDDDSLRRDPVAGHLTPCLCASCKRAVPERGFSEDGQFVAVRPVAHAGGDPDA